MKFGEWVEKIKDYIIFNPQSAEYPGRIGFGSVSKVLIYDDHKAIFLVTSSKKTKNMKNSLISLIDEVKEHKQNVINYDLLYIDVTHLSTNRFTAIHVENNKELYID